MILQAENFEKACMAAEHAGTIIAKINDWDYREQYPTSIRDRYNDGNGHHYHNDNSNMNDNKYIDRGKVNAPIEGINQWMAGHQGNEWLRFFQKYHF